MTCRDCKPKYRFLYRAGDTYYWEGPKVDSRREKIECNVDWFWGLKSGSI